jgi:hypothetical protein
MTATFAALLFAYILAEFVLFNDRLTRMSGRFTGAAARTGLCVAAFLATTGSPHPGLLLLGATLYAIDFARPWLDAKGATGFLALQGARLAGILALAAAFPDLWSGGLWPLLLPPVLHPDHLPALMALTSGFVVATRVGGHVVGRLMAPFADGVPAGLANGGRLIGTLERALIFVLILTDQAAGIGFLIAAKSVLRFGSVSDDRKASEYIIIGTLASFAWAIVSSTATVATLSALPPLGIPDLSP